MATETPTPSNDLKGAEKALTYLMSVLGSPIRGLFNTIGNSVLTAASVASICALVGFVMWLVTLGPAHDENMRSQARYHNAMAFKQEVANKAMVDDSGVLGEIGSAIATVTDDTHANGAGVLLKFPSVTNAASYRAKLTVSNKDVELVTLSSPTADSEGYVTWHIPSSEFAPFWAGTNFVQITLYAVDANGYQSRKTARVNFRLNLS